MTQPADAPPAADPAPPWPPPAPEGPPVRAIPDRRSSLERAHDAIAAALDLLGEDGTALLKLEGEARNRANVRIAQALRYADAHLGRHIDEKSKSENVALGVLGGLAAGLGGMFMGHVLTKPEETVRQGWLRLTVLDVSASVRRLERWNA